MRPFLAEKKDTCVTGSSGGEFAVKRNHRYVRNFKEGDHDNDRDVCLTIKNKQTVGCLWNSRVKHPLHAAIPLEKRKNLIWPLLPQHTYRERNIMGKSFSHGVCDWDLNFLSPYIALQYFLQQGSL